MGCPVVFCVVTVPAYFNDSQKQATKDACAIAGLECVKIITEPVAAALAFGVDKSKDSLKKKYYVIFDFGGGTHDVTVLETHKKKFSVKTINGDDCLGGQDIDILLVNWCIKEYNI